MEKTEDYKTFRSHAITVIITVIVSFFAMKGVEKKRHSNMYNDFILRQAKRDSIISADSIAICKLRIERDSLLDVQELISDKLDSTLFLIKNHTEVKVTDKDVIEALEWIENQTLSH